MNPERIVLLVFVDTRAPLLFFNVVSPRLFQFGKPLAGKGVVPAVESVCVTNLIDDPNRFGGNRERGLPVGNPNCASDENDRPERFAEAPVLCDAETASA